MNNYDQSSSGENIELDVFNDTGLAQHYFNDFLKGVDGNPVYKIEGTREPIAYLIGNSDKPFYKKSQLAKMKKADVFQLWYACDLGYNDTLTKAEYIDDLLTVTIAKHYALLNGELGWGAFGDAITHPCFISRGYCQGDAIYIVDVGADYDVCAQRAYIDHLFWDAPVTIDLEIDGANYYDLLDDCYEYDKDAVIAKVSALEISDYAKGWIASNLPDEPNWS